MTMTLDAAAAADAAAAGEAVCVLSAAESLTELELKSAC